MPRRAVLLYSLLFSLLVSASLFSQSVAEIKWKHISSAKGDIPVLFTGKDQTSTAVLDVDGDGCQDFAVSERSSAPALVLYRYQSNKWMPYVIEAQPLSIAAGTDAGDVDGDGDPDIVAGGARSDEVWWWENPFPKLDPQKPWTRRTVKNFPGKKSHDQLFGDFDGDKRLELAFWNQGAFGLYVAEIPENVKTADVWPCTKIFTYSPDGEMQQRGRYPSFKGVNEHEGLAAADIDLDGIPDIVAGGRWFKHLPDGTYSENIIDAGYVFSRLAVGDLIAGGRPEVVMAVGDGWAPMMIYEWKKGTWSGRALMDTVDCAHSLRVADVNRDGHPDIWFGEMRLNGGNPDSRHGVLYGDGKGGFTMQNISSGIELHESDLADLDGDGDLDIIGKPFQWLTPRIDIWLQE